MTTSVDEQRWNRHTMTDNPWKVILVCVTMSALMPPAASRAAETVGAANKHYDSTGLRVPES